MADKPTKKRKKIKRLKLEPNEKVMRKIAKPRVVTARYTAGITRAVRLTRTQVMESYAAQALTNFASNLDALYEQMPWWQNPEAFASQTVSATNLVHEQAFYTAVNESVGTNLNRFINENGLKDILESSVNENVAMLTDLPVKSQRRVESIVNKSIMQQSGKSVSLEQQLLKGFTTDIKQARFIARDQTQRLYKSLNQFRQEKVGIKKYKWITSKDVRVRQTHKANNGKIFLWEKPPELTGHPGNDYNCRCFAQAIISV